MSISRVKPAGWAVNEKLTSAQMNAVDTNITNALDKRSGQSDTLASTITVTGSLSLTSSALSADGSSPVTLGSTLAVTGLSTLTGGISLGGNITIPIGVSAPTIVQTQTTTSSATGQTITIQAQSATGATSFGGGVNVVAGSGTSGNGNVIIWNGSSVNSIFSSTGVQFDNPIISWINTAFSPSIVQLPQTTNSSCSSITIKAQAPFASATGANRNPGSINLQVFAPTNSGTTRGAINFVDTTSSFLTFTSDSSGDAFISSGGTNNAIAINSSYLGFYGTGSVLQQNLSGALSAVTDANAKAVLTSIVFALSTVNLCHNGTT